VLTGGWGAFVSQVRGRILWGRQVQPVGLLHVFRSTHLSVCVYVCAACVVEHIGLLP
jgi:hypothetical protein